MTYSFQKNYEWSTFHWCMLSNFIIACLLSTNQDGVKKSYFLRKLQHQSVSMRTTADPAKKWAEIWNVDEQGCMIMITRADTRGSSQLCRRTARSWYPASFASGTHHSLVFPKIRKLSLMILFTGCDLRF